MTAPAVHALVDGSDQGLTPSDALEIARAAADRQRCTWGHDTRTWSPMAVALVALLAEHDALLRRVADAPAASMTVEPNHRFVLRDADPSILSMHGQRVRILAEVE